MRVSPFAIALAAMAAPARGVPIGEAEPSSVAPVASSSEVTIAPLFFAPSSSSTAPSSSTSASTSELPTPVDPGPTQSSSASRLPDPVPITLNPIKPSDTNPGFIPPSAVSVSVDPNAPPLFTATTAIPDIPAPSFASILTLPDTAGTMSPQASGSGSPAAEASVNPGVMTYDPSSPPTTAQAASSSASPTPSPKPVTINAPGGTTQWWVQGSTNYLFATPPLDLSLRVALTNNNSALLPTTQDLGTFHCPKDLLPPVCVIAVGSLGKAAPGDGYKLYLSRPESPNGFIAASDSFAIRPAGSAKSGNFSITIKESSPVVSFSLVPQATDKRSSGTRLSWSGLAVLAAVVGLAGVV